MTEPRTGAHRPGLHRAPRSSRRTLLLLLAAVLAVALVVVLVLVVGPSSDGDDRPVADGSLADVAVEVAAWVDAELPPEVALDASGEVGSALVAAGTAEDRLAGTGTGGLRVVEGDPGTDAVVVARFGAPDRTMLSVVDARPEEPTAEELDRRQQLAAAVLANPVAGATGRAAEVLRDADVDARLLGLVAVLVARLDAGIADLPRAPGQPEHGTPARRALIDSAGGERLTPGSEAAERVQAFIAAQEPPFAPDTVELTDDGLLVGFDYSPSPDADVTAATQ